jgi:hypothetical protein
MSRDASLGHQAVLLLQDCNYFGCQFSHAMKRNKKRPFPLRKLHRNQLKLVFSEEKHNELRANRRFAEGDTVISFNVKMVPRKKADPGAIEWDEDKFVNTSKIGAEWFVNHSCKPNVKLEISKGRSYGSRKAHYIALKEIKVDDEITANYLAVDWDCVEDQDDFKCVCLEKDCVRHVRGFRYLRYGQKSKLESLLSPLLGRELTLEKRAVLVLEKKADRD